jgi:hypothetical protein
MQRQLMGRIWTMKATWVLMPTQALAQVSATAKRSEERGQWRWTGWTGWCSGRAWRRSMAKAMQQGFVLELAMAGRRVAGVGILVCRGTVGVGPVQLPVEQLELRWRLRAAAGR